MKAKAWWTLGFFLMVLFLAGPASAAPVGKVTHLVGVADLTSPAGKPRVLKLGDPVENGDILRTKRKAKVGITFTDGNTLWLAEKTRMKISRYSTAERSHSYFDLFRGKSRTVVTKLARGSRMEVHTPTAVCGVRGTIIIGLFTNGESAFFLQGGAGYGYNKSEPGKEVTIPPGSGMVVANEKAEPVVKPSTAADVEQHMQDTSMGTGETSGTTGTTDGGSTLDVAIPWTPPLDTSTPPPTITDETTDVTFSMMVAQNGFAGTLEGSYGLLTRIGTISYSGTGPSGPAVTSLATPLTGTLSNGATYTGLIGGVTGTYHGFFNSIINNAGALGILAGKLDGTYSGGTITATGTLNYDTTNYVAASAFQGFSGIAVPTFATTKLSGLFSYYAPVETGLAYGYITTSGGLFGLWGFSGNGGEYINDGGYTTWISYYGYDFTKSSVGGPADVFMLGLVNGTDDMAGHTTLTGNDSIQYMDRDYMGLMSVSYMGEYLGANYEIAGTGIYKLAPLAFTGDWGGDGTHPSASAVGAFLYDNSGTLAGNEQVMYGLVGGYSVPWSGATTMYAMGSFTLSPSSYTHYLWLSDLTGNARSGGVTDTYRKFDGYMTGLWLPTSGTNNGTIEGIARTLFQNVGYGGGVYNGTIGILSSDSLSGNYYGLYSPSAGTLQGMWQASDMLAPSYSETITNETSLATGAGSIASNSRLAGKFNNGGSIYAEAVGSLKFYLVGGVYRPWGIYKMTLQSKAYAYDRPAGATTWSARLGGEGGFGSGATASGYWLATINGTWNDTGEIRGQLGFVSGIADSFSMWMTRDYIGVLSGQVFGVSDSSTSWVGESVGSYTGTKLAFVAEENGAGKFWDYTAGSYSLILDGTFTGLLGGVDSLFSGASGVTPYPSVNVSGLGSFTKTGSLDYTTILSQFTGGIPDQAGYRLSFTGLRTASETASSFLSGIYWNKIDEGTYGIGFLYSSSEGSRSSFTTHLYEDLPSGYQMWLLGADARLQAYQIATVASAPGIDDWVTEARNDYLVSAQGLTDGTITQKAYRNEYVRITDASWGVGVRLAGGYYDLGGLADITGFEGQSFTTTSSNAAGTVNTYDRVDFTSVDGGTGVFAASVAGARVELEGGRTEVTGAVAKGLFDPVATTWRMAGAGFSMETGTFLDKINGLDEAGLTAFQKATGIPSVVVGTADLAMTNNASNPNITALNMNNVTFLASQSGSAPQIWATKSISGSYSDTPLLGVGKSVTLGGGGLTADFTPVAWTGTNWGATVSGSGLLSNGSYNGTITFTGGAAGTITPGGGTAGTISGTGAGTAQAAGPF